MKITSLIIIVFMLFFTGCGSATSTQNSGSGNSSASSKKTVFTSQEVDTKVSSKFGDDNSTEVVSGDAKALVGNWYGENKRFKVYFQLKKDGTYRYNSRLALGKFYNVYRTTQYSGKWRLENSNSQIVLEISDCDKPLILSNHFPILKTPAGINLSPGSDIDTDYAMTIDTTKDTVSAQYTQHAKEHMQKSINDFKVDYFTMIAPKVNSEKFWGELKPMGYHYGHKLGMDTDEWKYALKRIEDDPDNYIIAVSDESWQTMIGHRKAFSDDIKNPAKLYLWFAYWKNQMQTLGKIKGTVLYFISGDAPAYWAGEIRRSYKNDPKNVPAKITQSRFPEALERNPSQSFAGVFQMMDYLRMKYAPNVKLSYTLKTWGIQQPASGLNKQPPGGWDNDPAVKTMAQYLNNYGVEFDLLTFNFNPRGGAQTDQQLKDVTSFYGAISKKMNSRDDKKPKMWIWKVSLWNKTQPSFLFRNIDHLVKNANCIGMTLGHGNDLVGKSGFSDNTKDGIYIKSWMLEYYQSRTVTTIPVHATSGLEYWR